MLRGAGRMATEESKHGDIYGGIYGDYLPACGDPSRLCCRSTCSWRVYSNVSSVLGVVSSGAKKIKYNILLYFYERLMTYRGFASSAIRSKIRQRVSSCPETPAAKRSATKNEQCRVTRCG